MKKAQDDARAIFDRMVFLFDEGLWRLVEPALYNKSGRTEFREDDGACSTRCLRDICPEWGVKDVTDDRTRESGEVKTRLTAPAAWRKVYAEAADEVQRFRAMIGLGYGFACAAARLYGAVDGKELADLVLHWWDEAGWLRAPLGEDTPKARREAAETEALDLIEVVRIRAASPFAVAYEKDGFAVSFDKYPPPEAPDDPPGEALAKMLELRRGKDRWNPGSIDDFMEWAKARHRDWPEEYGRLEDFIIAEWGLDEKDGEDMADIGDAMDMIHDALAAGRGWCGAVNAMRDIFDTAGMPPKSFAELAKLMCDAANHTRQDANRGFTPEEMVAMHGRSGTLDVEFVHDGFADDPNAPVVRTTVKTGRNDPCPCGSGRKYKKCCGAG